MTDREACIILNLISGIGTVRLNALSSAFGSSSAIFAQSQKSLESVQGISAALAEKIVNWEKEIRLAEELDLAEKGGVEIITLADSNYPELLREIHDPPACLYVRGSLACLEAPCLGMVGSRRITLYGREMAKHLAESAVYAGWTVVSGLAYGIDAVAHQATLDAGGKTVAVLGSGLARVHPQDHLPMAREIAETGALVSELPMEFPGSRQTFPRRNRIISGLSKGVVVVEAGVDSGALITAQSALEQGRLVFAVPGQADNPQARGCNSLIRQGAKLTETIDDILEEFEFLPGLGKPRAEAQENQPPPSAGNFSEEESKVLDAIRASREALSLDALAAATGLPAGRLLSILMKLEIARAVKQLPGRLYSKHN